MNSCPHLPPPGYDCPTCWWFANGGGSDSEPGGYLNASFSDFAGADLVGKVPSVHGTYKANTAGEFAGYTTSVIANKSMAWLKTVAPLGKPWVVTVASKAPHVPATPAPWCGDARLTSPRSARQPSSSCLVSRARQGWVTKGDTMPTFCAKAQLDALRTPQAPQIRKGALIRYANHFNELAAPRTPSYNASAEVLADHHWLIAQQGPITVQQGLQVILCRLHALFVWCAFCSNARVLVRRGAARARNYSWRQRPFFLRG